MSTSTSAIIRFDQSRFDTPFTEWIDLLDQLVSRRYSRSVLDYSTTVCFESYYALGLTVRSAYFALAAAR